MFDKGTLVLERIALAEVVKFMIQVLVDLAAGAVLDKKAAEDTESAHPHHLTANSYVNFELLLDPQRHTGRHADYHVSESIKRRTLAYEHPLYPSSYQNLGVVQFSGPQLRHGHGSVSAL